MDLQALQSCLNRWNKVWQRVRGEIHVFNCSNDATKKEIDARVLTRLCRYSYMYTHMSYVGALQLDGRVYWRAVSVALDEPSYLHTDVHTCVRIATATGRWIAFASSERS